MLEHIKNGTKTAYRPTHDDFVLPKNHILAIIEEIEYMNSLRKTEPWLEGIANTLTKALGFKYIKTKTGGFDEYPPAYNIYIELPGKKRRQFLGEVTRRIW